MIDELVEGMVTRGGGLCLKQPGGLQLSFPNKPKEFVAYAPTDQAAWATRLKWVEKQSAIFLLNAPILYAVNWKASSRRTSDNRGLRLSVGLTLSVGPPLPKRYTCVLKHGGKRVSVSEGGHLSLGKGGKKSTLAALPDWAETDLGRMAPAVLKACEYFQGRSEVQNAILILGGNRRQELTNLDRLYRRKSGSNDRLYGLPPSETAGSVPIEAELRKLQNIVLERYTVEVRVRVLSLGILEGTVPREFYSQALEAID